MRINCLIKCEYEHKIIFSEIYHHADIIITIAILNTVPSSSLILIPSALLLYDLKSSSIIVVVVCLLFTTSHTMDNKEGGPEPIESYLNRLQNAKVPPPQSERQQNSSKVWPITAGLTSDWLIVIIVNAAIALIVIIGICYICIRKANRAKRKASWLSSSEPYFVRRNKGPPIARSVSASNQNNVPPPVYTIPMDEIDDQQHQPINETNIIMHRNSNVSGVMNGGIVNSSIPSGTVASNVNKFRAIGRVTGHMANSNTVTLGESYDALKQAESDMQPATGAKMDDIPSNPAIYQPPSKEELKSIETSDEDETDITDSEDEGNDEKEMTKGEESDSNDRNSEAKIQSEKNHNMMGNNKSSELKNNNSNNHHDNNNTQNGTKNLQEKENILSSNNHNNNNINPEVSTSTANNNNGSNHQNYFIQKARAMEEKVTSMLQKKNGENGGDMMKKDPQQQSIVATAGGSSEPQPRPRLMSAGIQTSPKIWFGVTGTVNLKQEPLIEWESHPIYSDPFSSYNSVTERRYFIYVVSESNPYYRKNCIGKITLPAGTSMTLSDLRDYLMKADDNQLQEILKRDKAFKFLTETYRFVSQNEAIASIDQVYPTQGIFIKLSVPDMITNTGGRRAMRRKREMEASRRTPSPAPPVMINRDNPHNFRKSNPNLTKQHNISNRMGQQQNISTPRYGGQTNNRPVVMNAKERLPRRINFEQFDGDKPLLGGLIHRNRIAPTPYAVNSRNKCANSVIDCSNPGLMKCIRCSNTYYCSVRCKNEHRREHRVICSRPPWRC
ncbi:uncharacterized protein LOC141850206 [Brevipalpus obovatus]|uniref:uncharacterized protein LOC141850206 n=1 Tax=Brevipalpus obovatus TaxID=246614 RepID=UPI003D9EF41D